MQFAVLAVILEGLFLRILWLGDLKQHVIETIVLLLIAGLFYLVSAYLITDISIRTKPYKLLTLIVFAGLVFRVTVWPLYPALSDDIFRYRWEGKLQDAGGNPYTVRPVDAEWALLRDSAFPQVVGKDFKGVYGPLTELIELGTYRAVRAFEPDSIRQVFWFKLPSALFDLGAVAALYLLLQAQKIPAERLLIYGWSPLPVMEFWATGHNDALAIFLVLLALLAATKQAWTWAFAAVALATAAKVWPALLFPLFIGWKGWGPQRWYQWWVAIPILGLLAWPYWTNVWENARLMSGFVGGWRNNDSLFGFLFWLTRDLYVAKKMAFAVVFAAIVTVTFLRWPLARAVLTVLTVLLMVSANCHPWYLTWILPLLALYAVPGLLLWSALVPLAHAAVISWVAVGEWHGSTAIRWYEYVPVYLALVMSRFVRRER